MSARMRGGTKLARYLTDLKRNASNAQKVHVGFFQGATYPDGTPVATVAAMQEFGAVIDAPERTQTIYRSIDRQGNFRKHGRFVKASRSNFASDHAVTAHQIVIPARSFMRTTIAEKSRQWPEAAADVLRATGCNAREALETMGAVAAGDIQSKIAEITDPPLAPSTVKRRSRLGSENPDKPLIDTRTLTRSLRYQVDPDND